MPKKSLSLLLSASTAMAIALITPSARATSLAAVASGIPTTNVVSMVAPDSDNGNHFSIGPEVSLFFPLASKTRNAFGSTWTSLGVGFGSAAQGKAVGTWGPDIDVFYSTHDGNRAFVAPVGIAYKKLLPESSDSLTGIFYGYSVDAVLADLRDVDLDVHSGLTVGAGARALVGYQVGDTTYIELSGLVTSKIKSLDFTGLEIAGGFRF